MSLCLNLSRGTLNILTTICAQWGNSDTDVCRIFPDFSEEFMKNFLKDRHILRDKDSRTEGCLLDARSKGIGLARMVPSGIILVAFPLIVACLGESGGYVHTSN